MKYIDADRLKAEIERLYDIARDASYNGEIEGEMTAYDKILSIIASLQQEQPMLDSTQLIEWWHEDKEMLKEKDFRDDPWRLAYNAFMCGFGRGIAVKKQEQPEVDLEKEIAEWQGYEAFPEGTNITPLPKAMNIVEKTAKHFYELGLNARNENIVI